MPIRAAARTCAPDRLRAGTLARPTHPLAPEAGSSTGARVPVARVSAALQAVVRAPASPEAERPEAEDQDTEGRARRAWTSNSAGTGRVARTGRVALAARSAGSATRGTGPIRMKRRPWEAHRSPPATTSLVRFSRIGVARLPGPDGTASRTPLAASVGQGGQAHNWQRPVLECHAHGARLPAGAG
jgi:hypothetical protein